MKKLQNGIKNKNLKRLNIFILFIGYWLWSSNARRTYLSNYIHYFNNLALRLNNISQKKGKTQLVTGKGYWIIHWYIDILVPEELFSTTSTKKITKVRRSSTPPSPSSLNMYTYIFVLIKLNRRTWVRFGFCNSKYCSMLISSFWSSNIIFLRCLCIYTSQVFDPYSPSIPGWLASLGLLHSSHTKFLIFLVQLTFFPSGDGTPMDMWDFRGWTMIPQNKGLKEPQYLTPHLIRHVNRDVKLLILLRNPVDR